MRFGLIFTNPVTIDHDILQQDIDQISIWGEQSLMCFNTDKCHVMTLGIVQLKGNLTYMDRAHASYWLKAHGFIKLYWHVQEGKPAEINF